MALDVEKIREDFPILSRRMNGKPLAYLDNAATTQKPLAVLEAMDDYYKTHNANIHRGAYRLSEESTEAYEDARANVAKFIGAKYDEVIFTRNATESLNLVAAITCAAAPKGRGVLLTQMEHHSNIVPWQLQAKRRGQRIAYVKIRSNGTLCNEDVGKELASSPYVFSFTHVSNVLGTINNASSLCRKAKKAGSISCVDAAQSVPHMKVDVKEMGCDFLAFSGHKMLGPAGIGVLYMRRKLQQEFEPVFGGGDMIKSVSFEGASWNEPPHKFEAGTQNVAGAAGLSAAVDYLRKIGMKNVAEHERKLAKYCVDALSSAKGIRFHGPKLERVGLVSFNMGKIHAHDIGEFANREGVAIRAGHHCAMPLMKVMGEAATCRASFYIYNNEEEIDRLAKAVKKARNVLS